MVFIAYTFVPSIDFAQKLYDELPHSKDYVINEDINKALRSFAKNEQEAYGLGKKNTIRRLAHFEDFISMDYVIDNTIVFDTDNKYQKQVIGHKTNVVSKVKHGWMVFFIIED